MSKSRKIKNVLDARPTMEGAGVYLKRVFGNAHVPQFDPFLLLDDFHSDQPDQYLQGFPWHPHRGIETITYVLHGEVEHGDSLGNEGVISSGDVQWMTAGSGIVHQEMPKGRDDGLLWGFQLWANLPAADKMMEPRYQEIKGAEIPEVALENGVRLKVICGEVNGVKGPVQDIVTDPEYLNVSIPKGQEFTRRVPEGYTVFAYVIEGDGYFERERKNIVGREKLVSFDNGGELTISTKDNDIRFLLVSGKPIGEPVAWGGPIVMNTQEELKTAFEEYHQGTFLKHNRK